MIEIFKDVKGGWNFVLTVVEGKNKLTVLHKKFCIYLYFWNQSSLKPALIYLNGEESRHLKINNFKGFGYDALSIFNDTGR